MAKGRTQSRDESTLLIHRTEGRKIAVHLRLTLGLGRLRCQVTDVDQAVRRLPKITREEDDPGEAILQPLYVRVWEGLAFVACYEKLKCEASCASRVYRRLWDYLHFSTSPSIAGASPASG